MNDNRKQPPSLTSYIKEFFRLLPYWIVQCVLILIWWKTGSITELIIVGILSELLAWGQTPEDNNNNNNTSTRE